jgi:glutamate/aspartate transport system substrate-binding protein
MGMTKQMWRGPIAVVAAFATALGLATPVLAQAPGGTLTKIKNNGVIVLGHRESSVPLSYLDNNQNVVGYSHEIALRIVDAIKKQLELPNLQVKLIPINAQNRISLMQNGTIDLECGGTTNTRERRNQVEFSNTIAITETRLLTKKTSGIRDMEDLAGKPVVVTAGTTSERYLRKYADEKKLSLSLVSARDHAQSFVMLQSDRVAAFFMDADVLSALLAKARDAEDFVVTGKPQTKEALACMLRKEDPEFKALVDRTVAEFETSGDAAKQYAKWFQSPIPPNGINLNTPLSDAMKELFKAPNDRSFDD